MIRNYDIVIVGGGISSLYFLYQLSKDINYTNKKIVLLESSNRLGGRVESVSTDEYRYEVGAGRFSNKHKLLVELMKEFDMYQYKYAISSDYKKYDNGKFVSTEGDKIIDKIKKLSKNEKKLENYTLIEYCNKVLDKKDCQTLLDEFPYFSELNVLNARDSLNLFSKDFRKDIQYYILTIGLESIITKLIEEINKYFIIKPKLLKNKFVLDINDNVVITQNTSYRGKKIIFGIPRKSLSNINYFKNININDKPLLSLVKEEPLLRIYTYYDLDKDGKSWFSDFPKVITKDGLKFIIPMGGGLIMISYTDSVYAENMMKLYTEGEDVLIKYLHGEINRIFNITPPKPKKLMFHWYSSGAHYWTKGNYSKDYYDKILKPDNDKELYIIGETFSKHQVWIEGALETAKDVYNHYFEKKIKGGGKKYTMNQVKKHNTAKDGWLVVNKNVYKIDEEWIKKLHPGGNVIEKYLGTDVTKIWNSIHDSKFSKKKLSSFKIGELKKI